MSSQASPVDQCPRRASFASVVPGLLDGDIILCFAGPRVAPEKPAAPLAWPCVFDSEQITRSMINMAKQPPKTYDIVPFGKYKGQPVEVMRADRSYMQWLTGQDWARDKYPSLIQIVVNNFGEPEETPEHNALQARFLDRSFCWAFRLNVHSSMLFPTPYERLTSSIAFLRRDSAWSDAERRRRQGVTIEKLEAATRELAGSDCPFSLERTFEVNGWDVELKLWMEAGDASWSESLLVEIKPTLGDEYPATLRQIKSRKSSRSFLLIDRFTASGATYLQVSQIFGASGVQIITVEDVESMIDSLNQRSEE